MTTLPATLAAIRLAAGLSTRQLADRVSTRRCYVEGWESGTCRPSQDYRPAIARALGVPVTTLPSEGWSPVRLSSAKVGVRALVIPLPLREPKADLAGQLMDYLRYLRSAPCPELPGRSALAGFPEWT